MKPRHSAIRLIPNEAHTKLVLRTRKVLRIVPPIEGVFASDSGRLPKGEDGSLPAECEASQSGHEVASPELPALPHPNPTEGKRS